MNRKSLLNVISGAGSILTIMGEPLPYDYDRAIPVQRSDAQALASDWRAVGMDLWGVIQRFNPEATTHETKR